MTHLIAVYAQGPKAPPKRYEILTGKTSKGEEVIINALAGGRRSKIVGDVFQEWLNSLTQRGIKFKVLRSIE